MGHTENALWDLIHNKLPGTAERIENMVGVGIPDIHGAYIIDYFIEMKICSSAKKCSVASMCRDTQILWHKEMESAGSLIFVLVRQRDTLWLYKYTFIKDFWPENVDYMYKLVGMIEKKSGSFDWVTFKEIIILQIKKHIKERLVQYGICSAAAVE